MLPGEPRGGAAGGPCTPLGEPMHPTGSALGGSALLPQWEGKPLIACVLPLGGWVMTTPKFSLIGRKLMTVAFLRRGG